MNKLNLKIGKVNTIVTIILCVIVAIVCFGLGTCAVMQAVYQDHGLNDAIGASKTVFFVTFPLWGIAYFLFRFSFHQLKSIKIYRYLKEQKKEKETDA